MKKVGIALLGLGTVGGGTYKILEKTTTLSKSTKGLISKSCTCLNAT